MYKTTGRTKPADKEEMANIKSSLGKITYVCSNCDIEISAHREYFDDNILCSKCGKPMEEVKIN